MDNGGAAEMPVIAEVVEALLNVTMAFKVWPTAMAPPVRGRPSQTYIEQVVPLVSVRPAATPRGFW